jgi:hypothetical protein
MHLRDGEGAVEHGRHDQIVVRSYTNVMITV